MVKNTVIALVAAASLAGIAVPAFAAPVPAPATDIDTAFGGGSTEMRDFIAESVLAHRIILDRKAASAGDTPQTVLRGILASLPVAQEPPGAWRRDKQSA